MSKVKLLLELRHELSEYCDPNDKTIKMVDSFIATEKRLVEMSGDFYARLSCAVAESDDVDTSLLNKIKIEKGMK